MFKYLMYTLSFFYSVNNTSDDISVQSSVL